MVCFSLTYNCNFCSLPLTYALNQKLFYVATFNKLEGAIGEVSAKATSTFIIHLYLQMPISIKKLICIEAVGVIAATKVWLYWLQFYKSLLIVDETSNLRFWNALNGEAWLINATDYGHGDLLIEFLSDDVIGVRIGSFYIVG